MIAWVCEVCSAVAGARVAGVSPQGMPYSYVPSWKATLDPLTREIAVFCSSACLEDFRRERGAFVKQMEPVGRTREKLIELAQPKPIIVGAKR